MPATVKHSGVDVEHAAEPPRIPAPTREFLRAEQERRNYIAGREQIERRSILRGLLVLALLVLLLSIAHAGLDRVFPHGWWRP